MSALLKMHLLLPISKKMKFYFLLFTTFLMFTSCKNQKETVNVNVLPDSMGVKPNPYINTDQSPMDMSYFPADFPLKMMEGKSSESLFARIIYSRPHKKNRLIFGDTDASLCKYGKEWRLGANEATEIQFFRDVYINNRKIAAGQYIIYCIPFKDKWTIVLNTNLHTWGLHMDPRKDIFRTDVNVQYQNPALEDFTMLFLPANYGTDLLMSWDNVKVFLPISFNPQ